MEASDFSAESQSNQTRNANLCFALLSIFSFVYFVMAMNDLGDLFSWAPVRQVAATIRYVQTTTTVSMGRTSSSNGSHAKNTIFIDGSSDGFKMPANIFTPPTTQDLRDAHRAVLEYYDAGLECQPNDDESWIWVSGSKSLFRAVDFTDRVPAGRAWSGRCYQVVSASFDGKEYFSHSAFRWQILLSVLGKLVIASIVPALWWLALQNSDSRQSLSRKSGGGRHGMSQEDFM